MGIWSTAAAMAAQTPPARNRYVDFLRAVSILFVVVGHWLIATVFYADGTLTHGHLLKTHPETHWLTWLFQVMPIFFIVGGYSNGVSLESAQRKGIDYAGWLGARLNRLVGPLLALLIAWAAIALALSLLGFDKDTVQFTSRSALIPTWFLATYIMLVVMAPLAYRFWQRAGWWSFATLAGLAVLTDLLFFTAEVRWFAWSNYFWVWLSVHQLGFAWRDGRLDGPTRMLMLGVGAFVLLYLLIFKGPYPFQMVGSPDEDVSNVLPPKITLLVLGLVQLGFLLSIQGPMRRALEGAWLWTATVLINSMIMTVYLWHMTVMIAVVTALYYAGGIGIGMEPGAPAWWYSRPVWIVGLFVLLMPAALLLSPFERRGQAGGDKAPGAFRQVIGAMMISFGVAMIAMFGFRGGPVPWLDMAAFALVIVGAYLCALFQPMARRAGSATG